MSLQKEGKILSIFLRGIKMKEKILIIDDEKIIRTSLQLSFRNEGYEFYFAEDGIEGLEQLKKITPTLIILDIRMPRMDGIEFLEAIDHKMTDPYAIIMLTAHGTNKDVQRAYELGVNIFLRKPFNVIELVGLAKSLIVYKKLQMDLSWANELLQKKHMQLIHTKRLALLGEVTSSIAHQLKQPLMIQKMTLDEIEYDIQNDKFDKKETLQSINEAKSNLSLIQETISQILSIGYFDEDNYDEKIDLNILVIETDLLIKEYLTENDVTIKYNIQDEIPQVIGSSNQLQQIFLNLITNAVDALNNSDQKIIELTANIEDNKLLITFTDNGPGIPEKYLPRIFDTFFTSKDKRKGTGLGLSICKSIVESHNGEIEVESILGKGTKFKIILPV